MKKCVLGLALVLPLIYAASVFAGMAGGDTAWAVLHGEPDRVHQPWAGDPQHSRDRTKNLQNAPQQEVQPQQDPQSKGKVKK